MPKSLISNSPAGIEPKLCEQLYAFCLAPLSRRELSVFIVPDPPHTVLHMPALSPTMTKGKIASWNKKEGLCCFGYRAYSPPLLSHNSI
jgi:hypothetical protein